MKIYRIAGKITDEQLAVWIKQLVNREFGGEESATEGWCGVVAGEISKYLKSLGEQVEMWGVVDWNEFNNQPAVIEDPDPQLLDDVLNEVNGAMTHSFVKWNGKYWDGKGNRSLEQMMTQHGFGMSALGDGQSIIKER